MGGLIPDELAVWGDELLEKGDPLGDIIARGGDAELQRAYEHRYFKVGRPKCVWKHGIIEELKVETNWGVDVADEITKCPALRFLRLLEFRLVPHRDFRTTDPMPILVERGLPGSLRALTFWPRAVEANLSGLYAHIRNIERFSVWEPAQLGKMELPQLTSLGITAFGPARLAELEKSSLPELERLEISMTPPSALAAVRMADARKLTTLSLARPPWGLTSANEPLITHAAREWHALFEMPLTNHIRRFELQGGSMGPDWEAALLPHVPKLDRFPEVRMAEPRSEALAAAIDGLLGDRVTWT